MKKTFTMLVFFLSAFLLCLPGFAQVDADQAEDIATSNGGENKTDAGFSMNGAMGATVINGVSYQFFSLRPDIPIWKFGLGLDLSFYFDADGNLREEDWNEAGDYIEKIYYVRYGRPGQPLYIRGGSLAPITLGYGLIMRRYTNAIEWPQVRRIGLQTEINSGPYKIEALLNNFRELESPGLVGGRFSYSTKFVLPVVVGGTLMFDGNQYLGLDDEDGDGIPDRHDMFPGETDQDIINELRNVFLRNEALLTRLINQNILPDIRNPTKNFKDDDEAVVEFGVDVGIPLIQNKVMSLWAYAQAAQIVDYGRGYTFPGLTWKMGPFRAGVEYRIFEKEFVSDFFGLSYEIERVEWDEDADDGQGKYVTKEEKLDGIPSGQGYYVDAGADIFGYLDIYGSYQNMIYDDSEIPNQSLYAKATLNTSFIPKIDLAEGYFQQPNADKVFSTDQDGTIIGYKVGASLGAGVMLVYDNKTIYHNGEPNRIMTVETVMKFK